MWVDYWVLISADLEHLRVVSKQQHDDLARDFKMSSHIVSAKTGESVSTTYTSFSYVYDGRLVRSSVFNVKKKFHY